MPVTEPARFQVDHPGLIVRFLTGDRLFWLEYDKAHVAIWAGAAPDQPDNVVQPFVKMRMGLYASTRYAKTYGVPTDVSGFAGHHFVGHDDEKSRAPFNQWLRDHVADAAIVFRVSDNLSLETAVLSGAGIGSCWFGTRSSGAIWSRSFRRKTIGRRLCGW